MRTLVCSAAAAMAIVVAGVLSAVCPPGTYAQELKLVEPETIGVIHLRDRKDNMLLPLDRETSHIKASPGFFKAKAKLRVNGVRARLRVSENRPDFIVQLANGVDPNKIKLYKMTVSDGKRETVIATAVAFGGVKSELNTTTLDVTRYGVSSYKLTPPQALLPGEYVLVATDSTDAYCFGVDASAMVP